MIRRGSTELSTSSIGAVVLAVLLVTSATIGAIGPALATSATGQDSSPSGLTALPNSNIQTNYGPSSDVGASAGDFAGSTMASSHPESLELTVTTGNRVLGPNGNPIGTPSDLVLQLVDDTHHNGRQVAVPMNVIRQEHGGEIPERAYGYHESGERWTSEVRREGSLLVFDVPKFSTNNVVFSGRVELSGSPSTDGSSYSYEVADLDAVEDYSINVTGVNATETDTESGVVADGGTLPVSVSGTHEPRNPSVTLTGVEDTASWSASGTDVTGGDTDTINPGGNMDPENASVTFYGNGSSTSRSPSYSGVSPGASKSITVDGNLEPEGPRNGEPELTLTAHSDKQTEYSSGTTEAKAVGYEDSSRIHSEFTISNPPSEINKLRFDSPNGWNNLDGESIYVDIYIVKEGIDGNYGEGTKVKSDVAAHNWGGSAFEIDIGSYDTGGASSVTVEFVSTNSLSSWGYYDLGRDTSGGSGFSYSTGSQYADDAGALVLIDEPDSVSVDADDGTSVSFGGMSDGQTSATAFDMTNDAGALTVNADAGSFDWTLDYTDRSATVDPGVDVDGDGVNEAAYSGTLQDGESVTRDLSLTNSEQTLTFAGSGPRYDWDMSATEITHTEDPAVDVDGDGVNDVSYSGILSPGSTATSDTPELSLSTSELDVSTNGGSRVDVEAEYTEVTASRDPTIEVNGQTTSYPGVLDDGEQTALSTDPSWIQNGTNRVNVSVSDSVSSDAPTGRVELDYSHKAVDQHSVDYVGEEWSERYNVSKVWADDRENATVEIDMTDTVVDVRELERRINGTTWEEIPESEYNWSGTALTYDMGSVSADTEVEIRVTGSKVRVGNGELRVLEPTGVGQQLDTEIEIVEREPGFYVEVSGTTSGDRVHIVENASWTDPDPYTEHEATGEQYVYFPNAANGSTGDMQTLPLEVNPETGDANIWIENASTDQPKFRVGPGSSPGDDVEYVWHATESGVTYELYSESAGLLRDDDTAESPVYLWDDDSDELLVIQTASSGTSSGSSSGSSFDGSGSGPVGEGGGPLNSVPIVLLAALFGVAGVGLLFRRVVDDRVYVLGGTALVSLIAIVGIGEWLRPGIVLGPVGENLGRMTPVITIVAVMLGGYYFYVRFIRGYGPGYGGGGK